MKYETLFLADKRENNNANKNFITLYKNENFRCTTIKRFILNNNSPY